MLLVWPEIGRKEDIMSEFTKGELEEIQSCCNSIDLISKEDGSIVAQITECEEDELSNIQRANAKELIHRWNSQPDLLEACKGLVEDLKMLQEDEGITACQCVAKATDDTAEPPKCNYCKAEAAIAKATHKP